MCQGYLQKMETLFAHFLTMSGQLVAWCIANSETSEVVEVFLSTMKVRSPMTPVRVLMTDDGELNKFA